MLVGEGTYPFHPGGVSTWCHQLIQGMPEHRFTAVAVTVDGTERSTWSPPGNLEQVVNIPLWGPAPNRRGRRRTPPASFAETHLLFLRTLLRSPRSGSVSTPELTDMFLAALRAMFEYSQVGDLRAALVSNAALERLQWIWREAQMDVEFGPLTLRDALTATDRIEHLLRPLSHPPLVADVCHLSMNGISALVALASRWAHGTRIVMSEHGVYLRERYLGLTKDDESHAVNVIALGLFRAIARAAYRSADLMTPHSNYNRRWQLYNGADPARVQTMYNGIDPTDFPTAEGEPDVPTIVFVGRIDPLKDLHTLIRAFAIVRSRVPAARLRMFGPVTAENEQYHASCVALVQQLGLAGAAAFEGRVPRQADAYAAGHLVALTSVSEGFPYTVVESMSMGRPPVCTNVGGVSEAVGDAGFVVPPRDHAAVAHACIVLLGDAALRRKLGARARQRVLERFTLDQWNDAYRDIYAKLVPDPRANAYPPPPADGPTVRLPRGAWQAAPLAYDTTQKIPITYGATQVIPVARARAHAAPVPDEDEIDDDDLTSEFWDEWWHNRGIGHDSADRNRW